MYLKWFQLIDASLFKYICQEHKILLLPPFSTSFAYLILSFYDFFFLSKMQRFISCFLRLVSGRWLVSLFITYFEKNNKKWRYTDELTHTHTHTLQRKQNIFVLVTGFIAFTKKREKKHATTFGTVSESLRREKNL